MKLVAWFERRAATDPSQRERDCWSADRIRRVGGVVMVAFEVSWLATLVHNLAIGAGLCAVWQRTFRNAIEWHRGVEVLWRPGCGRSATCAWDALVAFARIQKWRAALPVLGHNLAQVALAERCFNLGRFAGMCVVDEYDRPPPWLPGRGLSADHECKDCGAPMRAEDVGRFETCDGCAAERRGSR